MKTEALATVEQGDLLQVQSPEEYAAAAEYLRGATALVRRIQEYHAPLKKAASDAHKQIVAAEKAALEPLEWTITRIKGLMIGWDRQQAKLAEKERARLQAQADKRSAKTGLPAPVIQAAQAVAPQENMHNRMTWRAEVIDLTKVPKEYLIVTPDQKALNEIAKRMKKQFNIPGCRAVEDSNIVVKGV